jgi:hypothetical protein
MLFVLLCVCFCLLERCTLCELQLNGSVSHNLYFVHRIEAANKPRHVADVHRNEANVCWSVVQRTGLRDRFWLFVIEIIDTHAPSIVPAKHSDILTYITC